MSTHQIRRAHTSEGPVLTRVLCFLALTLGMTAPVWAQSPSPQVEYYHLDAVGSVRAVTNQSGQVVRRHDYFPFGEGDGVAPGTTPQRFTAKVRDAETGLDYFGARYYAQRSGRFTSVDPKLTLEENLLNPQRWNRYAYALNNPLRYIDPDGREVWSPFQTAPPSAFEGASSFLTGAAKGAANFVIALNSPGHMRPEVEAARFFEPANNAEAAGMMATGVGLFFAPLANRTTSTMGGRLGNSATRQHVGSVASQMESRGWNITNGGGRFPEEYLPGPGGARTGSSYPDITATKNGRTLRVNTIDTRANGVTPTAREATNAARIRSQTPGDHLLLVPKSKQ